MTTQVNLKIMKEVSYWAFKEDGKLFAAFGYKNAPEGKETPKISKFGNNLWVDLGIGEVGA